LKIFFFFYYFFIKLQAQLRKEENMKRILMLLVVVLMLFFTNLKAQVVPNPIKIEQAKQKVGQVVTVFGVVNSANFKYPELGFYLVDNTGSIFVDGIPYNPYVTNSGDSVFVAGIVKNVNGVYSISSDEEKSVQLVIGKQNYYGFIPSIDNVSLSDLLNNPRNYEGENVTIPNIEIQNASEWPTTLMLFNEQKDITVVDKSSNKTAKLRIYGTSNIDGQANPLLTPKTIKVFVTVGANNEVILVAGSIEDLGGTFVPLAGKITIEEARLTSYVGKTVTVAGVVTSVNFGSATAPGYYITDGTAGMYLYKAPVSNIGDSIEVTGSISVYNGLTEITVNSSKLIKTSAYVPAPKELTIQEFLRFPEFYEGQLVTIKNIKMSSTAKWPTSDLTSTGYNVRYVSADDDTKYIDIRLLKSLNFYILPDRLKDIYKTKILNVTGLLGQYTTTGKGGYQLFPRDTNDFKVVNPVSAPSININDKMISYNYPNPFNPVTNIIFKVNNISKVTLKVYDVTGKLVADLADKTFEAGVHTVQFNGENLPSGMYFYQLNIDGKSITRKMMLIK